MRYFYILLILCLPYILKAQPIKQYELKPVTVTGDKVVDTAFGTWKFSVADYEFVGEKLLLLTYERSLKHAKLMLAGSDQRIEATVELPEEAKSFYKDYQGYINVLCETHIYRVLFRGNGLKLGLLPAEDFKAYIMPCIDSLDRNIYFSNYRKDYPEFSYYAYRTADSSMVSLRKVTDEEQLKSYNMEYYFLPTSQRFQAAKIERQYGIDKHKVAAMMSGVTSSMYYTPLYAPLFKIHDTICVFDHYSNYIYKYNNNQELLDSVAITYHHPKNWREWKHRVIVDELTGEAYALYQKNGYYTLHHINLQTGKITGSYRLANSYVDQLKVRNGYVYYVHSPFESLQQFFVYRELIIY